MGCMLNTVLLTDGDPARRSAEELIKTIYAARYGADLRAFPTYVIALVDSREGILCAAGLRFADDGFFSEAYLDTSIEAALSALSARIIDRRAIFEVTSLVSRAPLVTGRFVEDIATFGERAGFDWSFFTLTRRLQHKLSRQGIELSCLGGADRRRIADAERWGTYYAAEPKVYAVPNLSVRGKGARHGELNASAV
jgi:hypothetical protein